jgi:hypothetical protein
MKKYEDRATKSMTHKRKVRTSIIISRASLALLRRVAKKRDRSVSYVIDQVLVPLLVTSSE